MLRGEQTQNPGMCPWPEIEPKTLQCAGWYSNCWAKPARTPYITLITLFMFLNLGMNMYYFKKKMSYAYVYAHICMYIQYIQIQTYLYFINLCYHAAFWSTIFSVLSHIDIFICSFSSKESCINKYFKSIPLFSQFLSSQNSFCL